MNRSSQGAVGGRGALPTPPDGPEPTPAQVIHAYRNLTKAQRGLVERGCISGDFSMVTIRHLKSKGLFYLRIDSPNGQCGFMELTRLGRAVRRALQSSATLSEPKAVVPSAARHHRMNNPSPPQDG